MAAEVTPCQAALEEMRCRIGLQERTRTQAELWAICGASRNEWGSELLRARRLIRFFLLVRMMDLED